MMRKFQRIITILLIGAIIGLIFALVYKRSVPKRPNIIAKRPNIIVIVVDTLRADHLPFYGYKKNTAPFLDRLSNKSVIFENSYSTSSWTAPATASIFTSLYPFQHGVMTGFKATLRLEKKKPEIKLNRIPDEVTTIAEVFKNIGYKTYAVSADINISKTLGFAQGFDKFESYRWPNAETINNKLKEWEKTIKAQGPYFLYIHYDDPHQPYQERSPWYEKDSTSESNEISAYDSEISYIDDKIREIFNLFKWSNNTLLIITSDHGEEFNDHGQTGHSKTLYSEVIHVPLLIYFPEGGWESRRIADNVSTIDILPTLREFVGLPLDKYNEGVSLIPYLRNKELNLKRRYLFSHLVRKTGEYGKDMVKKAVIYENWKYIITLSDSEEIFDLENDPKEKLNRINEEADIAQLLKTKLFDFENNCKKYGQKEVVISITEKELKELRFLGYPQ